MPSVYDDMIASLHELIEMAEGKATGAIVHRRTVANAYAGLRTVF